MADTFLRDEPSHPPPRAKKGSAVVPWMLVLVLLGFIGTSAHFGLKLYNQEQARMEALKRERDEAAAKLAAAEEARRLLEERVGELNTEKSNLAEEKDALSNEVREKETELTKLKATYDNLEEKMKSEIKKGEIRLSQANGRIQVDLVDKILFDSGQAELATRGQEVLGRIGAILAKVEDKQIQVSGHTDDSPIADKALKERYPTNWELSVSRAVNVVRYLADKTKVPEKRLLAAGYGEYHPIASNATPAGRARNRRIEILLTPTIATRGTATVAKSAPAPAPAARKSAKR